MSIQCTFLGSGRSFECADVPAVQAETERTTVWRFHGDRSISYVPGSQFVPFEEGFRSLVDVEHGSVTVHVVERVTDPPLVVAIWDLDDAYLVTFVDDPIANVESMVGVAESIRVGAGTFGPTVSYLEPLVRSDDPELYKRDAVMFGPATVDQEVSVEVIDLETRSSTTSDHREAGDTFVAWERLASGILVRATGDRSYGSGVASVARSIAESLTVIQ